MLAFVKQLCCCDESQFMYRWTTELCMTTIRIVSISTSHTLTENYINTLCVFWRECVSLLFFYLLAINWMFSTLLEMLLDLRIHFIYEPRTNKKRNTTWKLILWWCAWNGIDIHLHAHQNFEALNISLKFLCRVQCNRKPYLYWIIYILIAQFPFLIKLNSYFQFIV